MSGSRRIPIHRAFVVSRYFVLLPANLFAPYRSHGFPRLIYTDLPGPPALETYDWAKAAGLSGSKHSATPPPRESVQFHLAGECHLPELPGLHGQQRFHRVEAVRSSCQMFKIYLHRLGKKVQKDNGFRFSHCLGVRGFPTE